MMDSTAFTPWLALSGGALIGLAAATLWLGLGRIAGISGIAGSLLQAGSTDRVWRGLFLLGLVGGALLVHLATDGMIEARSGYSWWLLVPGAFLVGLGTRMGSGCTSGHGVCGISRLSVRGFAATAVFMATAVVTVFLVRHLIGVGAA